MLKQIHFMSNKKNLFKNVKFKIKSSFIGMKKRPRYDRDEECKNQIQQLLTQTHTTSRQNKMKYLSCIDCANEMEKKNKRWKGLPKFHLLLVALSARQYPETTNNKSLV